MLSPEDEIARLGAKPTGVIILEVPEDMRSALKGMRPDEVETFVKLVRMEPDSVQKILDFMDVWQGLATTARVMKWIVGGILAAVILGVTFTKNLQDGWIIIRGWFK